ncbi:MAG: molybdopterin-guanine dinucleotide biosynthesis protein B [Candidatus Zipacnadales bacterium]
MDPKLIRWTPNGVPVFGIAGYSSTGKTTLLEGLIPLLLRQGLRVGLLKHTAHPLVVGHPNKDTSRLYRAGAATVDALDGEQWFSWRRLGRPMGVQSALAHMPQALDIVLIEGFKTGPFEKIWIGDSPSPPHVSNIIATVSSGDCLVKAEAIVMEWLNRTWVARPWGIVTGDKCVRVILGEDRKRYVELPLAPDATTDLGPVITVMRWLRGRAWVWLRGYQEPDEDILEALLAERRPALWRVERWVTGLDQPVVLFEPQMSEELGVL